MVREDKIKGSWFKIKYFILLFVFFVFFYVPAFAAEKTIGVIMTGNILYYNEIHKSFIEALSAEGLGQGKVEIILQRPAPTTMAWINATRKLAAYNADVIVSYGASATITVMTETSGIPIVYAGVYDPQTFGLSGENITGISSNVPIITLLKYLRRISNFSTLGVVFSHAERDTVLQANEVEQLAGKLEFLPIRVNFGKTVDASKIANIDALFLTTGCDNMNRLNDIIEIARKAKIPTASIIGGGESSGIILTIAADPYEQGREAAKLIAKVIKGTKPSTLPVEQPKKVDVVINLKEAGNIGLKVPFDLLVLATKVIK
jgi:putative ABC transport system substrate-binding protein